MVLSNIHCHDDLRSCGAKTIVTGQTTVTIGDKLIAVEGDKNSHGEGGLIASKSSVSINGKSIIIQGDNAAADSLCVRFHGEHCAPKSASGSNIVQAY